MCGDVDQLPIRGHCFAFRELSVFGEHCSTQYVEAAMESMLDMFFGV